MRKSSGYAALAAILMWTAGCGGNKATSQDTSSSSPGTSPPAASAPAASGQLAAVSPYDSGPRAFEGAQDEAGAKKGEQLFKDKGCSACHAFGRKLTCPDLAGVTQRRTAKWIEQQILHPDVMVKTDPISHDLFAKFMLQMPNQGLTTEEVAAVIAYFRHKDHEAGEASKEEEHK